MKNIKQKVIGVVAAAIAVSLFSAFYMIEEGQQAVIVQFGRPVGETVTEAGSAYQDPFCSRSQAFRETPPYLGWRPQSDSDQRTGVYLG